MTYQQNDFKPPPQEAEKTPENEPKLSACSCGEKMNRSGLFIMFAILAWKFLNSPQGEEQALWCIAMMIPTMTNIIIREIRKEKDGE